MNLGKLCEKISMMCGSAIKMNPNNPEMDLNNSNRFIFLGSALNNLGKFV